jgi:DNA-binding transcriptional ArsR family regulator
MFPYFPTVRLRQKGNGKSIFKMIPHQISMDSAINICNSELLFRYLTKYLITIMNALFKALNDETRRQILDLLKDRNMNAGEIAGHFNISKPSISHHLDILKRADLITSEKKGQYVNYALNTTILEDLLSWIITLKK